METMRLILIVALALVSIMIWQAWQQDYGRPASAPGPVAGTGPAPPTAGPDDLPDFRRVPLDPVNPVNPGAGAVPPAPGIAPVPAPAGGAIEVKTDLLDIRINAEGGGIEYLALLDYPVSKKAPDEPVVLLKRQYDDFYVVQGGLLSKSGETANHKTRFESERDRYALEGRDSLSVPLSWESEDGLRVIKTYTFYRGRYDADVDYTVINTGPAAWAGSAYAQINRTEPRDNGSAFIYTYTGAVLSSPEQRYEKIDFGDIEEERLAADISNGWAAMLQHYFITALIPDSKEAKYHYYTLNPDNSYVIGAITPARSVAAGQRENFRQRLYFGPKLQKELARITDGLELTVDYGIFWFIAKPLFWVLDHIHTYTGNWGWSIVLVTLLLKLVFYHLSAAGYRSMANMRKVQPRLLSIRERYKSDRARQHQAMMALYKEEKINPLGGCFPVLVQIPVFISLYWVLLESVELRQADFVLWINDLSAPDPYFVLPLIMGATMFIQQKLNPAPMDPMQQKIMSILPVIFTVFFAFFPSGLVLYWVANNILSIAQQWMITRSIERAAAAG